MDTFAGVANDPVTLHKYLYANVDPVNMVDPSGNISMMSISAGGGGFAILGTLALPSYSSVIGGAAIGGSVVAAGVLLCLSDALNDLIVSKVSGKSTGPGICKAPKMRVQVQASRAGTTFLTFPFVRGESVLMGSFKRGVTRSQVRRKLLEYDLRFGEFSSQAPPGARAVFKSMVIEVSNGLNRYSGVGTPGVFFRGIVSAQRLLSQGSTIRIDVDNLSGTNLMFNN